MKKKLFAATALAASGALLAGCSSTSAGVPDIDPDSTLAVIELVEMGMELDGSEKYKLVVVSKDGSTTVTDTGTDSILVNWTDNSLFLADNKTYTWKQPGTDALVREHSDNLEMAFNIGPVGEDGSTLLLTQGTGDEMVYVVVGRDGNKEVASKEDISAIGTCSGATYGIGVNSDFVTQAMDDVDWDSMSEEEMENYYTSLTYDSRSDVSLLKVTGDGELALQSIGKHPAVIDTMMPLGSSLACSGDEIVFLSMQSELEGGLYGRTQETGEPVTFTVNDYLLGSEEEGGRFVLTLERWNTTTGERTVLPISDSEGKPFVKVADLAMGSSMGQASLKDGALYWVDGLGRLVKTDVQTGTSEAISQSLQTSSDMDKLAQMMTSFNGDTVTILVHSTAEPDKDRIVSLEIPSGKEITSVDVPKLGGIVEAVDMSDPNAWETLETLTTVVTFVANPKVQ